MKTLTTALSTIAPLILAAVAAQAQEAQAPTAAGETAQTSEFRTFDPTEAEWEIFRSSGEITHEGGEAVYNATCAGCHRPDGEGAVGAGVYPALADNELLAAPSYPIYLILEGQRAMPPLGGFLDDQQIADVVNYIRSSFGNEFVEEFGAATAEQVAETRQ